MVLTPLGDKAVVITWNSPRSLSAVSNLAEKLRSASLKAVNDVVPAYAAVTVFYEPAKLLGQALNPFEAMCREITKATATFDQLANPSDDPAASEQAENFSREKIIPVYYGGEYGPDLAEVAAHAGLSEAEVIALHSGATYRVEAIGFAPGFPYLSGLPPQLAMPRRATPRTRVAAGSVGIGGAQTGIYPRISPGGWRLLGRTSEKLFDLQRDEPAWLRVGDAVKFRAMGGGEDEAPWK